MKVLFITPGPEQWASARLRASWIAKYMADARTIELDDMTQEHMNAEAYIFIKAGHPDLFEHLRKRGGQVWIDWCDPAWWFNPTGAREVCAQVNGVTFSTEALRHDFIEWYARDIRTATVPDRLDLEHFPIRRVQEQSNPVRFVWYGSVQNRTALFAGLAYMDRLASNGCQIELTIMDDRPEETWNFTSEYPVYYVRWNLEQENQIIAAHDIALLPPYPGPWGRLKSNNKRLTAWACGLPVTDGQDYHDMLRLVQSHVERRERADTGYKAVVNSYQVEQSAREWEALLCST